MTNSKHFSGFLIIFPLIFLAICGATDIIKVDEEGITYGKPLVSSGGKFELGFFSPGNSKNWYVGIWFKNVSEKTVAWVANRDSPLSDNSGVLKLTRPGILLLLNSTNGTAWASNATSTAQNPVAQLLDSGNFVVRDERDNQPENFKWQSFEHPTDTYIAGMNLGWNFSAGREVYLSSWKSRDDPATGEYTYRLDPTGYPQVVLKRGSVIVHRIGSWNGIRFPGTPNPRKDSAFNMTYVMDDENVYYRSELAGKTSVTRTTLNYTGVAQRWILGAYGWMIYFSMPADICDNYMQCGAYANCEAEKSPPCECLDRRFVPKNPEGWGGLGSDWSSGCVRRRNLSCGGDVFLEYSGIKLPDTRKSWHDDTMTLDECRGECLRNCSCMGYTQLDIKKKSGCLIWFDELVDIRDMSLDGQIIYIRMASSEADSMGKRREIVIACSVIAVVAILVLGLYLCYLKKKKKKKMVKKLTRGEEENHTDLQFWEFTAILKATYHFSNNNKLGEGGFGSVYKGVLENGQEIAVKRLSEESQQGVDELKNEVIFISKLQHRNLVKLLGCCIEGDESMLIYEYLPNKSLDVFLFGRIANLKNESKSRLLNWQKRFEIINGIARGLLYLHQDSRLRIIHRDLKASNILLDCDMNPKISDFGLARCFGGNQTEARTRRIVGTYGYMSPEYALDGQFSVKSDVFSFGVLLLEIVTGKRNRGFSHDEHSLNLLGHAWILYKEGRSMELIDACLKDEFEAPQALRLTQVGLLYVQQNPEDRPSMSTVVWMLGNEGEIPQAKHPGFFTERGVFTSHKSGACLTNELTITMPMPR